MRGDHVLVYQIGALGDTIVSIPSFRAVRRHFKGRPVHLLEAKLKEGRILPSDILLPEKLVDRAVQYEHQETGSMVSSLRSLRKAVRRDRPWGVVYLGPADRLARSVRRDRLFFRMAGVKNLFGFHAVDYGALLRRDEHGRVAPIPHQAQSRIRRLAMDGVSVIEDEDMAVPMLHPSIEERERALDFLASNRRFPDRKLLAIGIWTAKPATRWPIDRFRQVGEVFKDQAELMIVGGPGETQMAEELVQEWGSGIVATGGFSVRESAALLQATDLYLGLDTGTTHIAGAVGARIVAIHPDNSAPGEWDPLGKGHVILRNQVECGGCRLHTCPKPDHPCMTGISVEDVCDAVSKRLAES